MKCGNDTPPPPRNVGTSTIPSESPSGGRPKYDIDLAEALRLHSLGNLWESVSDAMGVARRTMYYHLNKAGLSTARKPFTEMDGHSQLIIYLICSNNKRASTVEAIFMASVAKYGWPSRGRGDYGRENNGAERRMVAYWGEAHRAYLRGR